MFEKLLIVLAVLLVLIGWNAATGNIKIETDNYACYNGNHFLAAGDKQRIFGMGRLHFYYQPLKWGCDGEHVYKVGQYHVDKDTGLLVPN